MQAFGSYVALARFWAFGVYRALRDFGLGLLVGYHGEPEVNLFHNIRII